MSTAVSEFRLIAPPREWFDAPEPDGPEPLTVEADGRVHGHLALWDACHSGFTAGEFGQCLRPPRSRTDYREFHLGALETADGETIPVGRLVTAGGHAGMVASMQEAQRHYDNTQAVGAFVRARDGQHGIYLTGAVRSDAPAEVIRDMRANPPSGDWRGLNGNLEMVAALSVPVPGFQTPQLALTAAGDIQTLILPGLCAECEEPEEAEVMQRTDKGYIRKRVLLASALDVLVAAPLTSKRRSALRESAFAVPSERKFPIQDASHARNALARASGTKYEAQVRRAVCRRYPNMGECAK